MQSHAPTRETTMYSIDSRFGRGRTLGVAALAGVFTLAAASPASAVVNSYLFVDGIKGPSTTHQDAIDLLSFSVGVATATTTTRAGAIGASKPICSDLSVMK